MARDFAQTTNNRYQKTPQITALPLSMFAWFSPDTTSGNKAIISLGDSTSTDWAYIVLLASTNLVQVNVRGNVAGDTVGVSSSAAASLSPAWNNALATCNSDASTIQIFLNGSKDTDADATPATVPDDNFTELRIGAAPTDSFNQPFSGRIAEAAVWNVVLTDAEAAMLNAGVSPLLVRPDALVHYVPMIRQVTDLTDSGTFTETGTSSVGTHPPIIRP